MARIKEHELIIPALRLAAARHGGYISTSDLIAELEAELRPVGQDAQILYGRQDTYFSQKVRNLISHRAASSSLFAKGYATYTGDGLKITYSGRRFLSQALGKRAL